MRLRYGVSGWAQLISAREDRRGMSDPREQERQSAAHRLADTLQSHGVSSPRGAHAYAFAYLAVGTMLGLLAGWLIWG